MTKSQSDYNSLNKDQLIDLVKRQEEELKTKKYGLVWDSEKEPEKVVTDCENNIPVLQRIKDKRIKTNDSDDNILIEGDNYHALTCLNYTHKGKIDVIYIDPPYNTGNKSWKYNNCYVEKDDSYYHSKWLNMMSKRLELAKNLLSEDGCLVCAIDENELSNLDILMKTIFKGYNVDQIAVIHNPRGVQGNNFSYTHEYALFVYPRNSKVYIGDVEREKHLVEELRDHGGSSKREDAKNCFYPFLIKDEKIIGLGDVPKDNYHPNSKNIIQKSGIIEIYPIDSKGIERKWVFAKDSVSKIMSKLHVKKRPDGLFDIFRTKDTQKPRTVWFGQRYDASTWGSKIVKQITKTDFPYPKSIYTVFDCISILAQNRQSATILDFFAGSGTTGHAVLDLNKQDGGNRKFILCTNNENNICEDVTYPRIHNVIKGYKFTGKDKTILFEKKLSFSGLKDMDKILSEIDEIITTNKDKYDKIEKEFKDNLIKITGIKNIKDFKDGLGGNLQYFKTDLIPIRKEDDEENIKNIGDKTRRELTYKAGQMIAIKENCFEEIELNEYYQIFENNDKSKKVAIYFREDEGGLKELTKKIKDKKTTLYIFSHGKIDKKSYKYLGNNIKIEDIPEPILEIYREINLTLKD